MPNLKISSKHQKINEMSLDLESEIKALAVVESNWIKQTIEIDLDQRLTVFAVETQKGLAKGTIRTTLCIENDSG